MLAFPTVLLYSNGYQILPASLVLINATFDYVDGALSRFEKEKKKRIVQNNNLLLHPSKIEKQLNDNFGAHWDALADKLFALPVWTVCLMTNTTPIQLILSSHILIESYSAFFRTKAYYLANGQNNTASSSSNNILTAQSVGKIKQAISMLGTSLLLIDETKLVGGGLLLLSLPFAIVSILGKLQSKGNEKPINILPITEKDSIENVLTVLNQTNEQVIVTTSNEKLLSLLMNELENSKIKGFVLSPLPKDFLSKYNMKQL